MPGIVDHEQQITLTMQSSCFRRPEPNLGLFRVDHYAVVRFTSTGIVESMDHNRTVAYLPPVVGPGANIDPRAV